MAHRRQLRPSHTGAFMLHRVLAVVIPLATAAVVLPIDGASTTASDNNDNQCRLYMAPSSTSTAEKPTLGLFAGVDYDANVTIGNHDVVIQVLDWASHNQVNDNDEGKLDEDEEQLRDVFQAVEQYLWTADSSGGQFEVVPNGGVAISAMPGVGVLGNPHNGITNADWDQSSALFRRPMGERPNVAHPGRGAYTPYYNASVKSLMPIPAGMEIFLNFGDDYLKEEGDDVDDDDEEKEDLSVTADDYRKLDAVVDRVLGFMDKYKEEMTPEVKGDIYKFLSKDVLGAAAGAKADNIKPLLPDDPDELQKVQDAGGTLLYNEPNLKRDMDWLHEYGQCLDNIRAGPSTIPDAGRGAFATRSIPKGGLVSPAPLIQICDDNALLMYELTSEKDVDGNDILERASGEVVGEQLLVNYCFGHPDSSLLLYPFGSVSNLINHKPTSEGANARVVWSANEALDKGMFELSPEKLCEEKHQFIGLMFDIIATRDIEPDEEVFIDYGSEWEEEWEDHVKVWTEKVKTGEIGPTWPTRALDLNDEYRGKPFKTPPELAVEAYPNDIMTACMIPSVKDVPIGEKTRDVDGTGIHVWDGTNDPALAKGEHLTKCEVMERFDLEEGQEGLYNYTAYISPLDEEEMIVRNVPHWAIQFYDKPGRGDMHFEGAFRHYIGIPDEIFQDAWKNMVDEEEGDLEEDEAHDKR